MNEVRLFEAQITSDEVEKHIYTLRNQAVMLDSDLAKIYEIETRVLKQAVRRNMKRFPTDFMFELDSEEQRNLRSQILTLRPQANPEHYRFAPFAFTEQGVAMLSSVLHSERAIAINVSIMRVFTQLREEKKDLDRDFERIDELERRIEHLEHRLKEQMERRTFSSLEQVRLIQIAVADHFGITAEDLKSADRSQSFTLPRHIAIYLVRNQVLLTSWWACLSRALKNSLQVTSNDNF